MNKKTKLELAICHILQTKDYLLQTYWYGEDNCTFAVCLEKSFPVHFIEDFVHLDNSELLIYYEQQSLEKIVSKKKEKILDCGRKVMDFSTNNGELNYCCKKHKKELINLCRGEEIELQQTTL